MMLDNKSAVDGWSRGYLPPIATTVIFEVKDTLAKSNTEQIGVDDDEYGWG